MAWQAGGLNCCRSVRVIEKRGRRCAAHDVGGGGESLPIYLIFFDYLT